ncbi:MAG TPA: TonB family protein [Thermoanaerobaculia bacterium]|nr:TonB family protein [Thermoanaerobaculia bacterium]
MDFSLQDRGGRGLVVLIILGAIFLGLIVLIVLTAGRKRAEAPPQAETLTVLPQRVRIRTEPNAKAPVVASATSGEKLILLEERGGWTRVQDPDGLSGWVERNSLERTTERERRLARYEAIRRLPPLTGTATQRTPLYAGPGIFYPVVGELAEQTPLKIFTRDHDFYAIDRDGQVAYADIDAIDVTASGAAQLNVQTSETPAAPTETTATPAPPATQTTTAPPSAPIAEAPQAPQPLSDRPDSSGVYPVVPAGGTQPEEIARVVPRYPPIARQAGVQGSVVIRGIVRRDGRIDDVEVIKDLPYGLGDAAREAVERWHFRPATFRGEPIDVYYTVTVNFRLSR